MSFPPPRTAAARIFSSPASSPPLLVLRSRRHRSPTLPMNPSSKPSEPLTFSSPDSLSSWLLARLPPSSLATWGSSPGSKTLHNLFLELSLGESALLQQSPPSPPVRCVHVATVRIRNSRGAVLVESHQILSNGDVRYRGRPLSEKMRPGETVEQAAVRAVREEIGPRKVRIRAGSYEVRVEERVSASYPGLPARYVLHSVEAEVDGLPEEGEFSTEETGECDGNDGADGKAVCVRSHFWKWVDDVDGSCASGA